MYTHANLSFSEKKNETACKKNNTFKYNILNCYPFCQEVIRIVVYKRKRLRKKASPVGQPKVKQV